MQAKYEHLDVEVGDDGVLICTLNRPDVLNAIPVQGLKDLAAFWAEVAEDRAVRAVVITGAGRAFCAGGDVRGMASGDFVVTDIAMSNYASAAWKNLAALPQPVIVAINGDAAGVGMFFAGLADFVVSVPTARFGDPHVKLGLVAVGAGLFAPSIGLRHTKALLLLGEMISADEAYRIGLVNRIVPAEELMDSALGLARKLASYPPEALRWTKQCMNRLLMESWDLAWDTEIALETLSASTARHHEAARAFVNRP